MNCRLPVALITALFISEYASAADWPQFRGMAGNGYADQSTYPVHWDANENVKWKAELPGAGNSSPIVSAGHVFVTVAESDGALRSLICFDRDTGEQLWVRTVKFDKIAKTHKTNPYCGSTPATDGSSVVVWHGNAGLYCYNFAGEQIWQRDLGKINHIWGYGSSPIIDGKRIYLNFGPGVRNYVTAIDLESGESIWTTDEPHQGDGNRNESGKYMGSWSTPVLADFAGTRQLICTLPTRVNAYDPKSGSLIWSCGGIRGARGDLAYSSPIIGDKLGVAVGGFKGPAIGFRLGGQGDVTETHLAWRKSETPQNIGSGVLVGKHIFKANAGPSTLQCINAATGEELWQERSPAGNHWGSIVSADGRLYVTGQNGTTVVFKPNAEKLEVLAANEIGESSNSTPAFSDGQIFLRFASRLYCIATSNDRK